ncbi:tail fiber assembly protein [Proteus sp. FME41]|uniref:tail fiber assembly protein n=1 Tax=Proteus sp. FME41 TaxID=2742608 RepID=UPI001868870C|nr:tail fiber assembly protein [Proteus sp. FME41]
MYYSASKNGFFNKEIHNDIPNDIKEISHEYYIELCIAQSGNKRIQADKNGYPVLIDLINNDDLVLAIKGNKRRNLKWVIEELKLLDYSMELGIISSDEKERRNKLMKYFMEVYNINISDGENIKWPEKPN